MNRKNIAVVGTGISGLSSAWFLSQHHSVSVFEQADRLGGHTNTIDIDVEGRSLPVDTGFIVYNEPNYPNLKAMFKHLNVQTQSSNMSFAVSVNQGEFEFAGSGLIPFLGGWKGLFSPKRWRLLREVLRFNRQAKHDLHKPSSFSEHTLMDYLKHHQFSDDMVHKYLLPMAAAIWSCPTETMMQFPAMSFLRFYENHGLLNVKDRPQWNTVINGSIEYIKALLENQAMDIRLNCGIECIQQTDSGFELTDSQSNTHIFDEVVLACHSDQAYEMLSTDLKAQFAELTLIPYQRNIAYVHTDESLMPQDKSLWSSWNYLRETDQPENEVAVTYWMNKLQSLPTETPVLVTLNPTHKPLESKTLRVIEYDHPVFEEHANQAQTALKEKSGQSGLWLAGAYLGYGFHEDGLRSAVDVARKMKISLPWENQA